MRGYNFETESVEYGYLGYGTAEEVAVMRTRRLRHDGATYRRSPSSSYSVLGAQTTL
jgi:hypothetical protein